MTTEREALPPFPSQIEELLDAYWQAGYDEGSGHLAEFDPNETLAQIREAVRDYARAALAAQVAPSTAQHQTLGALLTAIGELYIAMGRPAFEATEPTDGVIETLQEAAKRLAAQVAQAGWQPIETAPKDGTKVLCWNAEFGARQSRSITYTPGSVGHSQGLTDRWWEWLEPKTNWAFKWEPTHWMPLPQPPKENQP